MMAISLGLILVTGTGCGTIRSFATGRDLWLYSGTRSNVGVMNPGLGLHDCTGLSGPAAVLDFPWSLAVDTALIPLTLPLELFATGEP